MVISCLGQSPDGQCTGGKTLMKTTNEILRIMILDGIISEVRSYVRNTSVIEY